MTPFNLERALAGDPVGTRDGQDTITQIRHLSKAPEGKQVIALISDGRVMMYGEDGKYYPTIENSIDLVMIPVETTYWYAIHRVSLRVDTVATTTGLYKNKEELDEVLKNLEIIAIRSVEVEERP